MTDDDRREADEARREGDRLVSFRLQELENRVGRMDDTLSMLGATTGHMALLDSRVDDNRRRITDVEHTLVSVEQTLTNLRIGLENVRTKVVLFSAVGSLVGAGIVAIAVQLAGH